MRRYPGLEPFSEKYKDVFFARDREKAELYELVKINRHILLYAKSGVGKTSLINAGLKPQLDKEGIIPINIRFLSYSTKFESTPPLQKFMLAITRNDSIKEYLKQDSLIKQVSEEINTPWLVFKHLQYVAPEQRFILIFDQFEELFSYPQEQIDTFARELSYIINNFLPAYFNALEDKVLFEKGKYPDKQIDILYQPVNLKAIFSIRDDRLSGLNSLTKYLPEIQKTYYELKPLTPDMAKEALINPAQAKGDFESPVFVFSPEALDKIIDYLSKEGTSSVEPVQLQLIALKLEQIAIERKGREKIIITQQDLPEFKDVFKNFYLSTLNNIDNISEREKARLLIEDYMIVSGQRMTLNKTFCLQYVSQQTLDLLTNRFHLLRVENISTGLAYELSHDTLVEPIEEEKKARQEEEKRREEELRQQKELEKLREQRRRQRTIIAIVSVAAVISLAFAVFGLVMWKKADKQKQIAELEIEKADLMQHKVETAMFDKAIKERFPEWLGYDRYDWTDEDNETTKKGLEILNKVDSLDLSYNALLRIPIEVTKCPNLKHINLLGNPDIDWKASKATLSKLSTSVGLYVSINDLSDIDSTYWHLITGIEILKNGLTEIPENILQQKQLVYLDLSGNNNFSTLPKKFYNLTNLRYLDLSACKIDNLSPEIEKLTKLTYLNLSGNQLTSLPPEIGKLTKLTYLNLSGNQLTSLPPEVGKLINLTVLDLSGNKRLPAGIGENPRFRSLWHQLTNLPPEIGKLVNLKRLDLSYNKLTNLPPEIGKLTNLTELDLSDNNLTSLPPEIGKLTNLTELNLCRNDLTSLPLEIGKLTNLTKLNLCCNDLTSLPLEIGKLTKLTELNLSSNQLTSLPPEIGKLTKLTELNLRSNQLTSLPPEIGKLTKLTELVLSSNQLTSLPPEIGKLTNLTYLDLWDNKLTTLPPQIGNLTNLTSLDLIKNDLTTLPLEIAKLTNLTKLNLRSNPIILLPDTLKNFLNSIDNLYLDRDFESYFNSKLITELHFSNIGITELSPEIQILINLTDLHLNDNNLRYLPPEIGKLANLTELDLSNNQLTHLPLEIMKLTRLKVLCLTKNPIILLPDTIKNFLKSIKFLYLDRDFDTYFNPKLITNLDFSKMHLTSLQPEIGKLTNLTSFDVSWNKLITLPPQIGKLTNLNSLDLRNNNLTTLPPEIANLTKLTNLDLSENDLTTLPPQIGNLTNLIYLDLWHNKLTSLPPEIGKLTNLTHLYLWDNKLTTLPPQIGNLTKLAYLNISENDLTTLPPEIEKLTRLTKLNLYGNHSLSIANICNAFANYPKEIIISSNEYESNDDNFKLLIIISKQTSLPPEIGKLLNLTKLDLSYNALTSLPQEIGKLQNLIGLDLRDNNLTALPPEIGKLQNLTELNLGGNYLTTLPPEIGKLQNLEYLSLTRNKLTEIPKSITNLKKLEFLALGGNKISDISWLPQLTNLEKIYLWGNPITEIPVEVAKFENLELLYITSLDLDKDKFTEFLRACKKSVQLTTDYKANNDDPGFLLIVVDEIEPEWLELPNVELYER